jgi:quinol monooxygenase YgiN
MILRVKADPNSLEQFANANAEVIRGVAEAGRAAGATRHLFAGGDGEVLVIDEWPDEASFQKFFDSQPEIPRIMQQAGAQGPPEISFYRKLDTPDAF